MTPEDLENHINEICFRLCVFEKQCGRIEKLLGRCRKCDIFEARSMTYSEAESEVEEITIFKKRNR